MKASSLQIEEIRRDLKVDTRMCVFEISEGFLKISDKRIYNKVQKILKERSIDVPLKLLGSDDIVLKFGVCNVGTASVFKEPSMRSEQVTQIILGETFDVLETTNNWVRVKLHFDGYIGWVYIPQVVLMSEVDFLHYAGKPKIEFVSSFGFVYSDPKKVSLPLRDIVVCSRINYLGSNGKWYKVELPDGTQGFISKDDAVVCEFSKKRKKSLENIVQVAKRFLGVSYLWGGKTPKGFDCSGFVQTVYRINGIKLPRDSDMQWKVGERLGKDFSRFKAGDLLFFSEDRKRITHVGIYTGRYKEVIHASGFVRINSLDKKSEIYSERLDKSFVGAKRILTLK